MINDNSHLRDRCLGGDRRTGHKVKGTWFPAGSVRHMGRDFNQWERDTSHEDTVLRRARSIWRTDGGGATRRARGSPGARRS